MARKKLSEIIVEKIMEDLKDRRGLRQQWDAMDPATQAEIRQAWRVIAKRTLEEVI